MELSDQQLLKRFSLPPKRRDELAAALKSGHLVTMSRGHETTNAWWQCCEYRQQPYIVVYPGTKYARVMFDLLPANKLWPTEHNDALRELVLKHLCRGASCSWGGDSLWMEKVPLGKVDEILAEMKTAYVHLAIPRY